MADASGRIALVLRRQEHVRLVVVDALDICLFFHLFIFFDCSVFLIRSEVPHSLLLIFFVNRFVVVSLSVCGAISAFGARLLTQNSRIQSSAQSAQVNAQSLFSSVISVS